MNCWHGKYEHLLFNLWYGNHRFYGILENLKMLILSCIIWEIDRKSLDKNEVENLINFVKVRLFKVFLKLPGYKLYIWKEMYTCELYVVLIPCHVWFPGNHQIWFLYSLWQWNQIQVSALSLWMTCSSLLPIGGRGSLIVCAWGCCPWGQETTCKRGPIWRALSAAHGGREKPWGYGWGCCPWGQESAY